MRQMNTIKVIQLLDYCQLHMNKQIKCSKMNNYISKLLKKKMNKFNNSLKIQNSELK